MSETSVAVGDWVRIDVDECGAPVGAVVRVVKIDSIGNIVIYNYDGYLTFYASRRNVTLMPNYKPFNGGDGQ